ncbi:hypothetical protein OSB04_021687 [Centaurea solstitialis]|uniref:Reverse transcriptase domain-containing protein n=1 Tax=Centaurea solstitialis TaxID=347529 RepID=A0AA38SWA1_9ASTR|nr:hypothetical protein OSB04_021687 [Centaurea solstitialis]
MRRKEETERRSRLHHRQQQKDRRQLKKRSINEKDFNVNGRATSFFFTNFPDTWSEANVWKEFLHHGKLVDVYIARKKTVAGRKFGFARFLDVSDVTSFEKKLDGIRMGAYKVKVNVARFERSGNTAPKTKPKIDSFKETNSRVKAGFSFADAVKGNQSMEETHVLNLESSELVKSWLSKNLIGRVPSYEILLSLGSCLEADGCGDLKLRYMGGLSVLLEFASLEDAKFFLEQAKETWSKWFDDLKFWTVDDNPKTRIASLVVSGFPPHAWSPTAFQDITKDLGKLIISDAGGPENMNLVAGKVAILTSHEGSLNFTKPIRIDGVIHIIRITEDPVESWNLMPKFPSTILRDSYGSEETSQGSQDFSQSEDENDYFSGTPGKFDRSPPPEGFADVELQKPPEGFGETHQNDYLENDAQTLENEGINTSGPTLVAESVIKDGHLENNIPNFSGPPSDAGVHIDQPPILDHSQNVNAPLGPKVGNGPNVVHGPAPSTTSEGSIDLNKSLFPARSTNPCFTFVTPRSRSRTHARRARTSSSFEENQPVRSNSVEAHNTIEIGTKVGFHMEGIEISLQHWRIWGSQMNLLSNNIRGVESDLKQKRIRDICIFNKVNILSLQETMVAEVKEQLIKAFWGNCNFDFVYQKSRGRSGGLITIWDPSVFIKDTIIEGDGFLAVIGSWSRSAVKIGLVNIYSPQNIGQKKALWLNLQNIVLGDQSITWILHGDFNEVRNESERKGSNFINAVRNGGRKFTRFSADGHKLSKLDRILVSNNFYNLYANPVVEILPRHYSDHCPLLLKSLFLNFGAIPFRFFNSWLSDASLDQVVKASWRSSRANWCSTNPSERLVSKLIHLKNCIKSWRKEKNKEVTTLQKCINELDSLDREAEDRDLSELEQNRRMELKAVMYESEKREMQDIKQKARIKWSHLGDENTKYFHSILNQNHRRNFIHGVSLNGAWSSEPSILKPAAKEFFEKKFIEPLPHRPAFSSNLFSPLSLGQSIELERPFSVEEIKRAVWACDGDKAQGPDGLTFAFIKKFWDTIGADFVAAITDFHSTASLPRGSNSSFVSLIPKIQDPIYFSDYRPISLISCFYKIISKLLSLRLQKVIDTIIGVEQTAFIKERSILDGPLVVNELISWAKKSKSQLFILKVDLEKAFDTLNWEFLDSVLAQLNFGNKWRSWVKNCLTSARISVLVNGSPTEEFSMQRGIRQGDPLAPFLFIIAMEALNVAIKDARSSGVLDGIKLPNNGPLISHFFYADDALFVGRWSARNVLNLLRILRCFHLSSGLKVNLDKTCLIGIGVDPIESSGLASRLSCKSGHLPFNFLGIPVGVSMNKKSSWQPLLEKFQYKLSNWKSSMLSAAGRLTLCKSVLGSLAPNVVLDKLESIRRSFFYGGNEINKKITWISWKETLASKDQGGLEIGSLKATNIALLSKWWWRIKKENEALWVQVIKSIHGFHRRVERDPILTKKGGVWGSIVAINKFTSQYDLNLLSLFQQVDDEQRSWKWTLDATGSYSVASLRRALDQKLLHNDRGLKTTWIKLVPSKVNITVWKAQHHRLATFSNLAKRGIISEPKTCPFCSHEIETENHLFAECPLARSLLMEIGKWWKLTPPRGPLENILNWGTSANMKGNNLQVFTAIIHIFVWQIWCSRNEIVFSSKRSSLSRLFLLVQGLSYSWINARGGRKFKISWQNWCSTPMYRSSS